MTPQEREALDLWMKEWRLAGLNARYFPKAPMMNGVPGAWLIQVLRHGSPSCQIDLGRRTDTQHWVVCWQASHRKTFIDLEDALDFFNDLMRKRLDEQSRT